MITRKLIYHCCLLLFFTGCNTGASKNNELLRSSNSKATAVLSENKNAANGEGNIFHEIPVLCYHQVRDWSDNDTKTSRPYIVPVSRFNSHMKILHDSGFRSILPDELSDHINNGKGLPEKAFILTFDDGTISQYENALPVLAKYKFKAVFFIMTVTLNKTGYLNRDQVRELSDLGHTIGCHSWDHHRVTRYTHHDWNIQLTQPTLQLERITGKPTRYFAYPYGLWNADAISKLQAHNYSGAFQLYGDIDSAHARYTVRRIIANGYWSASQLLNVIKTSFP